MNGTKDYQDLSVQTTKTNGRVSEKSWTDAAGQTVRSFSHGLYTDHVFTSDGKEIATISLGTKTSGDGKIALQLYDKEGKQTAAIQNPEITKGTSDATVKVGNSSILQKQSMTQREMRQQKPMAMEIRYLMLMMTRIV